MALASIVAQFDNFLIGTFVGYSTLGFYDRAYRIAQWPNLLLTLMVSRIGFVTFAKVQHDLPRLTQVVRLSLWALSTFGIPIILWISFGASDIVLLLYGTDWLESAFFLRFLAVYAIAWPFMLVGFWLMVALGHTRETMIMTLIQAVVMVAVATPLTWLWGVMGAIIGVGITMVVAFGVSCYYIFQQVHLSFLNIFGPAGLVASIVVITLLLLTRLTNWEQWYPLTRLLTIGIVGTCIFMMLLFVIRPVEMKRNLSYLGRVWKGHQHHAAEPINLKS
jgi:PST family polysaccharide transporter